MLLFFDFFFNTLKSFLSLKTYFVIFFFGVIVFHCKAEYEIPRASDVDDAALKSNQWEGWAIISSCYAITGGGESRCPVSVSPDGSSTCLQSGQVCPGDNLEAERYLLKQKLNYNASLSFTSNGEPNFNFILSQTWNTAAKPIPNSYPIGSYWFTSSGYTRDQSNSYYRNTPQQKLIFHFNTTPPLVSFANTLDQITPYQIVLEQTPYFLEGGMILALYNQNQINVLIGTDVNGGGVYQAGDLYFIFSVRLRRNNR